MWLQALTFAPQALYSEVYHLPNFNVLFLKPTPNIRGICFVFVTCSTVIMAARLHPFDPLTPDEISRVRHLLSVLFASLYGVPVTEQWKLIRA